jgi:hypothetical protein
VIPHRLPCPTNARPTSAKGYTLLEIRLLFSTDENIKKV